MVQDVLDRNIVPQLLKFLRDKKDHAALQVEALWALTNIAAGTTGTSLTKTTQSPSS